MDNLVCDSLIVATKLGDFRVHYTFEAVVGLDFPGCMPDRSHRCKSKPPQFVRDFSRQLEQYAAGKPVQWLVPTAPTKGTDFQRKVWRTLIEIPRGETRSYGWVADRVGMPKASRAVGAACGANPIPVVVPCHRVIAGDGSLGGFGGGSKMKRRLLALEGVTL